MKRLGRIIVNGLSALSLLVLVVAAWFWVRSYWVVDICSTFNPGTANLSEAVTFRGNVHVGRIYDPGGHMEHFRGRVSQRIASFYRPPDPDWQLFFGGVAEKDLRKLGFRYVSGVWSVGSGPDARWWSVRVPLWFCCALCVVMPVSFARRTWRIWRRKVRGQCRSCGYDLRATPERCPECGMVPAGGGR